jgi:hypothetical protein
LSIVRNVGERYAELLQSANGRLSGSDGSIIEVGKITACSSRCIGKEPVNV